MSSVWPEPSFDLAAEHRSTQELLSVSLKRSSSPTASGKKRRCAAIEEGPSSFESLALAPQNPSRLASTPAEFNLFTRASCRTELGIASPHELMDVELSLSPHFDLSHVRSKAFSELHQSITDNGENLIQRMREYEQSRSKHHKAREAGKRSRKRNSPWRRRAARSSAASDISPGDDDVHISLANSTGEWSFGPSSHKRSRSLDIVGDGRGIHSYPFHRPRHVSCSSPSSESAFNSYQSPSNGMPSRTDTRANSPSPARSLFYPLSCGSTDPSDSDVMTPISPIQGPDTRPVSSTQKVIDNLSLAFASGACGLNDYSSLLRHHGTSDADEGYDPGELWH